MALSDKKKQRIGLYIEGRVQGVGFRPTVFRYAVENRLTGFVVNTFEGIYIEAEGISVNIKTFLDRIKYSPPAKSSVKKFSIIYSLPLKGEEGFRIEKSHTSTKSSAEISPDTALCHKCLQELFTPENKRHLFPFINCTDCGPRFTITQGLPYDRKNTAMLKFMMCPDCYSEYINPMDRRFHSQPNCCFACGPEYRLIKTGETLSRGEEAIKKSAVLIKNGKIIAVKGIGGYHLICNAYNISAVKKLRKKKDRGDKPFALMAKDISTVEGCSLLNQEEKMLIESWQRPIVILTKREDCKLPEAISPFNKYLGFMLPYAPIHHLLFFFGNLEVIVTTSANIANSPIIYKEDSDSFKRLEDISDYMLINNRDIHNGCDDSVVRVLLPQKNISFLRKARSYTPDPLPTSSSFKREVFAAGPHEKNTFAFGRDKSILMSQHIGTINTLESFEFYRESYLHFKEMFRFRPKIVAYDMHPDYVTTQFALKIAEEERVTAIGIQHHHAHIASCMIENGLPNNKVIGIAMDGTGYGETGDIRGAEIMLADYKSYQRVAFLNYTPLPGGEKAIKEVWRTAVAFLYNTFGEDIETLPLPLLKNIKREKIATVTDMLRKNFNCPPVSSMGRLFDAIAAVAGIRDVITYDAQAAIELEMAAKQEKGETPYLFNLKEEGKHLIFDPAPVIKAAAIDASSGISAGRISYKFHKATSRIITEICKKIKEEKHISCVVLSGGVFQNMLLLEMLYKDLIKDDFTLFVHRRLPANDGCISAGQAAIALYSI